MKDNPLFVSPNDINPDQPDDKTGTNGNVADSNENGTTL